MIRQPVSCPVCGRLIIEAVLQDFHLTAEGKGMLLDVHAMRAFHCREEGHIFFIRASDLEVFEPAHASA